MARTDDRSRDALNAMTLYLVVLFAIPARLVIGPLGGAGSPAAVIGLGFLFWWMAARIVPSLGVARGFSPIRVALAALVGSILVSYVWSALHPLPPDQRTGSDLGMLTVLSLVGVALVATDMLSTRKSVEALLRRLTIGIAALAALGIVQFTTGFDITEFVKIPGLSANHALHFIGERSNFRRVAGTTSHPIEFGVVLALGLPLVLHFAAYAREHRRRWQFGVVLIGLAIPMTLSRSAILGTIAAFLLLFFTWPAKRRAFALAVTPVFLVVLRIMIPGLVGTLSSLFTGFGQDDSVQHRQEAYAIAGPLIHKSPWLGRGFGTFIPSDFVGLSGVTTFDNQYLGMVVECGYIGLAALLSFFAVWFCAARGARRHLHDEEGRDLMQSLAATAVVGAISFATFDGMAFPVVDGVIFLLAGCVGALWRLCHEIPVVPAPRARRVAGV